MTLDDTLTIFFDLLLLSLSWLVVVITLAAILDLLAHVHRYKKHRDKYPLSPRGAAWKGTK